MIEPPPARLLARLGRVGRDALLELLLPERCILCHAAVHEKPWWPCAGVVRGLRGWDRPHLCRACVRDLTGAPVVLRLEPASRPAAVAAPGPSEGGAATDVAPAAECGDAGLLVTAGTASSGALVAVIAAFKYHGVRGAAWPLAWIAAGALPVARRTGGSVDAFVPMPLHRRRERGRGFNQADVLARLLAWQAGVACHADVLRRQRATAQQARIPATDPARTLNVREAFRARPPRCRQPVRVALVDDLVTSGATAQAAAGALRRAGWCVPWIIAVGASEPQPTTA